MKKSLALASFLGLALLAGCADAPEDFTAPPAPPPAYPFVRLAPTPPPEPRAEEAPPNMDAQHQVWRRGYWSYDGVTFNWNYGQFIDRPSSTAAWSPDRWEHRTFGWAFVPGYWQ